MFLNLKNIRHVAGAITAFAILPATYAQISPTSSINNFVDPGFAGTTQFDGWDELGRPNPQIITASQRGDSFPGFPGFTAWPEAIESVLTQETTSSNPSGPEFQASIADDNPTGDATFNKIGQGNGYPAGFSIYASPFPNPAPFPTTSYIIEDLTPVDNLETVFFQLRIGSGSASGPGFDPWLTGLPTLDLDGGSLGANLAPDNFGIFSRSSADTGFGPVDTGILGFQWDLSGINTAGIGSIGIEFQPSGTSSTIVDLRLDQSDTFTSFVVIPEPASLVLVGLGGIAMLSRRHV